MFDGPYYLFKILSTKTQGNPKDIHRFFSHWIYEFLPVIYTKLVDTPNIKIAATLYNTSLIFPVYFTFGLFFRYTKLDQFLPALFLIILNSIAVFVFHVSESNIALYCFLIILLELMLVKTKEHFSKGSKAILLISTLFMAALHPGAIIFMPFILLSLFDKKKHLNNIFIPLAVIIFAGSLFQIQGFIKFKNLATEDYVFFFKMNSAFYENGFIVTTLTLLALLAVNLKWKQKMVWLLNGFISTVLIFYYFKTSELYFNPLHNYIARSVNFAYPPIVVSFLVYMSIKKRDFSVIQKPFARLVIISLIFFSFHSTVRYMRWNSFKKTVNVYLQNNVGEIPIDMTPFDIEKHYGHLYRYCSNFGSLFLQILEGYKVKSIITRRNRPRNREINNQFQKFFKSLGVEFH
jgi:hypothetical protein